MRLRDILGRALEQTAHLWPEVQLGASWVHGASAILANDKHLSAELVERQYHHWIGELEEQRSDANLSVSLRDAATHFIKVTSGYGSDLFHCYRIAGLPRTNNALEQAFGSLRYHERRASGRKVASPSLVLSGCVRMAASAYTRKHAVTKAMLADVPHASWRRERAALEQRRQSRCLRFRFRRDPSGYLAELEKKAGKQNVPS
jgi:hypothetical protein